MSEDEIARLGNRLAMLVSDDGEADNAGRAVGQLARRLGLSGGQLKAIFMAGVEAGGAQTAHMARQDARIRDLEEHLDQTRETLRRTEHAMRSAEREREVLQHEAQHLQGVLHRRRSSRRVGALTGLAVAAVLAGAGWLIVRGPAQTLLSAPTKSDGAGAAVYRTGIVHEANVPLRKDPDTAAPALATLPEGTTVVVRRTLWHNLEQWVEVEVGGQTGYVLGTEINLS